MSKLFSKFLGFFKSGTLVGMDKVGNRYFIRKEEIDGIMKEKRWVIFKGEEDSTSLPVEWICWLNGQRKKAPTFQEMMELEEKRECVKLNVARLKKEEEERKSTGGSLRHSKIIGKEESPELKSFIQQFPGASFDHNRGKGHDDVSNATDDTNTEDRSSEPSGSGKSFKPGTWQPPT